MVVKVLLAGARQFGDVPVSGAAVRDDSAGTLLFADATLAAAVESEEAEACALLRCIALNNDALPVASADGATVYKAASPDEEALVSAAHGAFRCLRTHVYAETMRRSLARLPKCSCWRVTGCPPRRRLGVARFRRD